MNKIVKLHCVAQQYSWGNYGLNSTVAQLLSADSCVKIDESAPYAELWMGAHPSAPSVVETDDHKRLTLQQYLEANGIESLLGKQVVDRFGAVFPFLFKVLSIRTALSIQSHPDSDLAKKLFEKFPDIYKDPYHKPEIAIALTPFKALCGFRPLNDIIQFINDVPELKASIHASIESDKLDHSNCSLYLNNVVVALLKTNATVIKENLATLVNRISAQSTKNDLDQLVLVLHEQYPGDVGVFFAYLLNYIQMAPGQALFLPAGEPHAYVAGDCVECMAPSDNVVRAGLTPKLKDVDTLAHMLTYNTGEPPLVKPICESDNHALFRPPVDEFEVESYHISEGAEQSIKSRRGPAIVLVLDGNIQISSSLQPQNNFDKLIKGTVLFVPIDTPFTVKTIDSKSSTLYIARVSERLFK
ncbi:mannose-6-phosphate isomerase [Heterostelium album PN500]|uniref:mannose-6-phosphate isomerase n=1 Tax=Heterostelium pallidum (strain ATCC 26659 / Pp 5 / PN500) TaxID=670386 RepID=D3BRI8_HETP5|nr:mannose-6-phosphate isomerase [Heterostelium album PN500]EFA76020.1 mannose-6-phosphate isomerase [Heterostelium album PN500]|eukprot:XP_020428154.1 mannose-6-phosphate isomerase [Heterostelium album PN500]